MPRILVADDEAPIARVVAKKLENAGYDVEVARDGQEAYERAVASPPDFLVTDLQMPGLSGLEVCARLAAELETPVPAVLLTAKGFEVDPSVVERLPIRRIMTKPFSPRELLAVVQAALAQTAST